MSWLRRIIKTSEWCKWNAETAAAVIIISLTTAAAAAAEEEEHASECDQHESVESQVFVFLKFEPICRVKKFEKARVLLGRV